MLLSTLLCNLDVIKFHGLVLSNASEILQSPFGEFFAANAGYQSIDLSHCSHICFAEHGKHFLRDYVLTGHSTHLQ
jgi:hypothetical protein